MSLAMDTEDIRRVVAMLRERSDFRGIKIEKAPTNAKYLGRVWPDLLDEIALELNFSFAESVREAVYVHEMLHIVLRYDGFPKVVVNRNVAAKLNPRYANKLEGLKQRFESVINHPEIFRRIIHDFNLDIDQYFDAEVSLKLPLFQQSAGNNVMKNEDYFFRGQQSIMYGIELFSYPEKQKKQVLDRFMASYPEEFDICLALFNKVKGIGFDNPISCCNSALTIRSHIIEYGNDKSIGEINKMWEALDIISAAQ